MSSISNETKKATDLSAITTPASSNLIMIHDGTGLKSITYENLANSINSTVEDEIAPLLYNNAGAHNAIYRGKYLGTSVTSAQYAAIDAGTFDDLYIGDYWTINSVSYLIAAFDYYLYMGDTSCTTHHIVLVPATILYSVQMNSSSTTDGGYVGSEMYTTNLEAAKTTITSAFGSSHILSHRVYLTNAVSNGHPSAGAWYDSTVELMNEQMVYGGVIFMPIADGSGVYTNYRAEKTQLPLFAHNPTWITRRWNFWLRDVVSSADFAGVNSYGYAASNGASNSRGVRPAFCICAA